MICRAWAPRSDRLRCGWEQSVKEACTLYSLHTSIQTSFQEKPSTHNLTHLLYLNVKKKTSTHTCTVMKHGSREQKQSPWNMSFAAGICWHAYRLTVCICVCVFTVVVYMWPLTHFAYCKCKADKCALFVLYVVLKEMDSCTSHNPHTIISLTETQHRHRGFGTTDENKKVTSRRPTNVMSKYSNVTERDTKAFPISHSVWKRESVPDTQYISHVTFNLQHLLCVIWIIQWSSTGLRRHWNMDTNSEHRRQNPCNNTVDMQKPEH